MARARISLPVPLSPVMRTLTLVRATRRANVISSRIRPVSTAWSPSIGASSTGQRANCSWIEARAVSSSDSPARTIRMAFIVATDSTSLRESTHTSNVLVPDWPEYMHASDVRRSADSSSSGLVLSPFVASTSLALSTQSASLNSATSSSATNRALRGWAKSAPIDWATRLAACGGRVNEFSLPSAPRVSQVPFEVHLSRNIVEALKDE